jgi:flagellar motor switch protein FliN
MDNHSNQTTAQPFAASLAEALAGVLTQEIGTAWQVTLEDNADAAMRQGSPVHYRLTMEGALEGDCFVEFYAPQVAELAARIAKQPQEDFNDEHAETLRKVMAAAATVLSAALSAQYGETTCRVEKAASLAFGGMFVVPLLLAGEEASKMPALLYFDGQLLSALAARQAAQSGIEAGIAHLDPLNLKLVMDVELNVSLRFGQRQMPLREVLELTSGSVIELDRQVDEPVELLLDGKLIARGEAVIVDGNYGLRVTEIPQPLTTHFIR